MRMMFAVVGRLKAGPDRELAERYLDRAAKIGRALGFRGIEVIEIRESRAREPERRITEEAIALTSVIPDDATLVALDGGGENLTSEAFAARLRGWRDSGRPAVAFVIGGADGLDATLRARADFTLALGAATWPHQLVRVMLLEQIYRAFTILTGHPYHRE